MINYLWQKQTQLFTKHYGVASLLIEKISMNSHNIRQTGNQLEVDIRKIKDIIFEFRPVTITYTHNMDEC